MESEDEDTIVKPPNSSHYVWQVDEESIIGSTVDIKYSTGINKYQHISGNIILNEIHDWDKGIFDHNNMTRVVDPIHNYTYLENREETISGDIAWHFNLKQSNRTLDKVALYFDYETSDGGEVRVSISKEEEFVLLPTGEKFLTTDFFEGETDIEIEVKALLTVEEHNLASRAQLFKQPINNSAFSFSITFTFS